MPQIDLALAEAERKFDHDMAEIFGRIELRMIPDGVVESVHSSGYAEDGETFTLMLEMRDGSTVLLSACPGERITAHVV
jgi:hypothetical protein